MSGHVLTTERVLIAILTECMAAMTAADVLENDRERALARMTVAMMARNLIRELDLAPDVPEVPEVSDTATTPSPPPARAD